MAENPLIDYDEANYDVKRQSIFMVTIIRNEEKEWKYGFGTTIGLYLNVKYLKKEYIIPVAPVWYLQNKNEFKENLIIKVTGVIQKISGKNVILPNLLQSAIPNFYCVIMMVNHSGIVQAIQEIIKQVIIHKKKKDAGPWRKKGYG